MPEPWATGLERTSSTPSSSRATQVPTMSMMASVPPTSWKCTCDAGRRCSRPSTSARRAKAARARWRARSGRRASVITPTMWAWVRTTWVSRAPDADVSAGQPGSQHADGLERPAADGQGDQLAFDLGEIGAGIDQAAERHVAGDPGKAVPPGEGRHRAVRAARGAGGGRATTAGPRMRATAQAAPNPLSMPTTTIPEAQDASMARRAVTPSRPAP